MWRASFEEAVGIIDPHPIEEQRAYFVREVPPLNTIRVAKSRGQVVGPEGCGVVCRGEIV